MAPLWLPLGCLICGILASPHLAPNAVWLCLPLAAMLGIARRRLLLLGVFLLGAGLRSLVPPIPPDPGSEPVRLIGRLRAAPQWRNLGVYLDLDVETIDSKPSYGRARLTEFL